MISKSTMKITMTENTLAPQIVESTPQYQKA